MLKIDSFRLTITQNSVKAFIAATFNRTVGMAIVISNTVTESQKHQAHWIQYHKSPLRFEVGPLKMKINLDNASFMDDMVRSFNKWAKKNRNLRLSNVNKTALLYQCGPTTVSIFTDATTLRNCL